MVMSDRLLNSQIKDQEKKKKEHEEKNKGKKKGESKPFDDSYLNDLLAEKKRRSAKK